VVKIYHGQIVLTVIPVRESPIQVSLDVVGDQYDGVAEIGCDQFVLAQLVTAITPVEVGVSVACV